MFMAKAKGTFEKLNEKIALYGTNAFGSMWAFYIFFVWGLLGMLPFLPQNFKNLVLLISSAWIQLWALPLLAVGNSVLNKESEKRSKQDHEMLKVQLNLMKTQIELSKEEKERDIQIFNRHAEILETLDDRLKNIEYTLNKLQR